MRNRIFDINDMYTAVRDYFMKQFPTPKAADGVDVLNYALMKKESTARLDRSENSKYTKFVNEAPTSTVLAMGPKSVVFLEEYLVDDRDRASLLEEMGSMILWMIDSGFLKLESKKLIGTEKLLKTTKITA